MAARAGYAVAIHQPALADAEESRALPELLLPCALAQRLAHDAFYLPEGQGDGVCIAGAEVL